MYEVELKVPADHEAVRDRLAELEAEELGAIVQEDTYYDAPHRAFAETDEALRIRRERSRRPGEGESDGDEADATEPDAVLTYKGPLVDDASKTREEVETGVADAEAIDVLLRNLGFEPAATVRKERERVVIDGYTVTLDSVDGVGEFVEVETTATEGEIDAAREGAVAVLERLDLDPADGIRTSYLEMVLEG